MGRYGEIYNLIVELFKVKKYKEVVDKVDKYINMGFTNRRSIYNMKFLRAKSLRYLGRFDEAIKELKELINEPMDKAFSKLELFFIYYYLHRYEDALKLLPDLYETNGKYLSNQSLSIAELVIRKNLGLPASFRKGSKSDYIKSQIVNYNEQIALEHINEHINENISYEELHHEHSLFNKNVNINYLFECVKNNLKNSVIINDNNLLSAYCFAVPGIGYDSNSICNYMKVAVVPNTTNIVAMYPFAYVETDDVNMLDCDLDKLFNRSKEEKSTSRIDRFNNRFNLK